MTAHDVTTATVLAGCEAVSIASGGPTGALVVHGFTGTPYSVRGVVDALAGRGHDVEAPRLPGHGTVIADMLATRWDDWAAAVDRAIASLTERVDRLVLVGQSMGGTLVLAAALERPSVAGVVCVNPLTRPRDDATMAMIDDFLDDGMAVVPGEGSDIADPVGHDISYDGTPLAPLRSLLVDGVASITDRFGEPAMPLRLFTSRADHVVDPDDSVHLADAWGGAVEHTWLERSYHVALRDHDRDLVIAETVAFVERVTA